MGQQSVRLKYAESDNFSPGGGITGVNNTQTSAKVKNLGFAKDVALHYSLEATTLSSPASSSCATPSLVKRSGTTTTAEIITSMISGPTRWAAT